MPNRFKDIAPEGPNGSALSGRKSPVQHSLRGHQPLNHGPDDSRKSNSSAIHTSDWASEITKVWARSGTQTLELAKVVSAARRQLRFGEWTELWMTGQMPFSKRKGEMLVVIGDRMEWIDAQTFAHLPTGWSVLYYLARLTRRRFELLLKEGAIHSKLTLKEAKRFLGKSWRSKRSQRKFDLQRWLDRFGHFIDRNLNSWRHDECEIVRIRLERFIQRIDDSEQESHSHDRSTVSTNSIPEKRRSKRSRTI